MLAWSEQIEPPIMMGCEEMRPLYRKEVKIDFFAHGIRFQVFMQMGGNNIDRKIVDFLDRMLSIE